MKTVKMNELVWSKSFRILLRYDFGIRCAELKSGDRADVAKYRIEDLRFKLAGEMVRQNKREAKLSRMGENGGECDRVVILNVVEERGAVDIDFLRFQSPHHRGRPN